MGRTQQRKKQNFGVVKTAAKEVNDLLDKCRGIGCTIERTNKQHIKISHPFWGRNIYTGSTPCDNPTRIVNNIKTLINRLNKQCGLEVI